MPPTITFEERQKELQSLLATPAGREEIQKLASEYAVKSGKLHATNKSAITYILVYERQLGLIST